MFRILSVLIFSAGLVPVACADSGGRWSIPVGEASPPGEDEIWGSASATRITFTVSVDPGEPEVHVKAWDAEGNAIHPTSLGWKVTSSSSLSRTETAKRVVVVGRGTGSTSASKGTYQISVGDDEDDSRSTWSTTESRAALLHHSRSSTVHFTVSVDAGEDSVTVKAYSGTALVGEWTVTEERSVSRSIDCTRIEIHHGVASAGEFVRNVD